MRAGLGVALVGLVACVGCGPTQKETVVAIEALGGKFELDENKAVVMVNLRGTKVTDAGLVHLKGFTKLKELFLAGTRITDAGVKHLKGLTSLERLSLTNTKVTGAGLAHLKGLKNLGFLAIGYTKVTDAGLVHLEGMTELKRMDLMFTPTTDAGVKKLQQDKDYQQQKLDQIIVEKVGLYGIELSKHTPKRPRDIGKNLIEEGQNIQLESAPLGRIIQFAAAVQAAKNSVHIESFEVRRASRSRTAEAEDSWLAELDLVDYKAKE